MAKDEENRLNSGRAHADNRTAMLVAAMGIVMLVFAGLVLLWAFPRLPGR